MAHFFIGEVTHTFHHYTHTHTQTFPGAHHHRIILLDQFLKKKKKRI